jgi:hypothetical protein
LLVDPRCLAQPIYKPAVPYLEMNGRSTKPNEPQIICANEHIPKARSKVSGVHMIRLFGYYIVVYVPSFKLRHSQVDEGGKRHGRYEEKGEGEK